MELDLIFFDEEMLVSKETRNWEVWQEKLLYYKTSLTFSNEIELLDYLELDYKISDKDIIAINDALLDNSIKYFLIGFNQGEENKVELTKTALDFLGGKGALVYWQEWSWVLSKTEEDFYLWAYLGGIADMVREIKLSDEQKNEFLIFGKSFIEKLAVQLQIFNSSVYSDAIKESRKIL